MARRVRIEVLCDVCQADDIESEADEIEPVTVGLKGKPLVLGLCKEHWPVYAQFIGWLSEYGASAEELPTGPPPEKRKKKSAAQPVAESEPKVPEVTRAECNYIDPETGEACTTVYEWPQSRRPTQALGVHRRRAHGIVSENTQKAS